MHRYKVEWWCRGEPAEEPDAWPLVRLKDGSGWMIEALAAEHESTRAQLAALSQAIVDASTKCRECGELATKAVGNPMSCFGWEDYCDEHAPPKTGELQYAKSIRLAVAVVAKAGSK